MPQPTITAQHTHTHIYRIVHINCRIKLNDLMKLLICKRSRYSIAIAIVQYRPFVCNTIFFIIYVDVRLVLMFAYTARHVHFAVLRYRIEQRRVKKNFFFIHTSFSLCYAECENNEYGWLDVRQNTRFKWRREEEKKKNARASVAANTLTYNVIASHSHLNVERQYGK